MRKRLAVSAVVALALLAIPPIALSNDSKYWDAYFNSFGTYPSVAYSGSDYWRTNRVWRPVPNPPIYSHALWFSNSSNDRAGFDYNADMNPFTIYGPFGYSQAACQNISSYFVTPVTCKTYTYYT